MENNNKKNVVEKPCSECAVEELVFSFLTENSAVRLFALSVTSATCDLSYHHRHHYAVQLK
ncbi:hypothetical protein OUZ56_021960 [Daphnia magna]|uniref:Uncharacterized protein n=1 Tax=Daphnia magna TaxID=35525 RepID=A0ABR0AUY2_9CRUS|nr:hypothetical protein OUZ56_021960 [Daphnia magna]